MDAPTSRYPRGLCARDARSGGLLGRGEPCDRLVRAGHAGVRQARPASTAGGSSAPSATTCYNAIDRARRARPRATTRHHLRLAGHEHQARHHLCGAAARGSRRSPPCCRTSASPRATASSSTCRWCPRRCSPCMRARASARSIPSSSAAFAAKELATRLDDCKPKLILSASCGVESARIVHYKPLLDAAIDLAAAKPEACPDPAAPRNVRRR